MSSEVVFVSVAMVVLAVVIYFLIDAFNAQRRDNQQHIRDITNEYGNRVRALVHENEVMFQQSLDSLNKATQAHADDIRRTREEHHREIHTLIGKVQAPEENYRNALQALWSPPQPTIDDEINKADEQWMKEDESEPWLDQDLAALGFKQEEE